MRPRGRAASRPGAAAPAKARSSLTAVSLTAAILPHPGPRRPRGRRCGRRRPCSRTRWSQSRTRPSAPGPRAGAAPRRRRPARRGPVSRRGRRRSTPPRPRPARSRRSAPRACSPHMRAKQSSTMRRRSDSGLRACSIALGPAMNPSITPGEPSGGELSKVVSTGPSSLTAAPLQSVLAPERARRRQRCTWSGPRWPSAARAGRASPPGSGAKRIRVVSAGGIATTRAAGADVEAVGDRTRTPSGSCSISSTGAPSTTESPSSSAIRRQIACEPPTMRSCWAPPSTSIMRVEAAAGADQVQHPQQRHLPRVDPEGRPDRDLEQARGPCGC